MNHHKETLFSTGTNPFGELSNETHTSGLPHETSVSPLVTVTRPLRQPSLTSHTCSVSLLSLYQSPFSSSTRGTTLPPPVSFSGGHFLLLKGFVPTE